MHTQWNTTLLCEKMKSCNMDRNGRLSHKRGESEREKQIADDISLLCGVKRNNSPMEKPEIKL